MNYLKATKDDVPCMSANDIGTIKWHVDAAFAIHKDMKSCTGATMTRGSGTICSISTKQKVNTQSSTEAPWKPMVLKLKPTLSIETIPALCDWRRMVKQAPESIHIISISSLLYY
jgi:hypothetical protein